MLNISNLHAYYGPIEALKGIDMVVEKGKITCLIGSNGAGKTTLLKSISGMIRRARFPCGAKERSLIKIRATSHAKELFMSRKGGIFSRGCRCATIWK